MDLVRVDRAAPTGPHDLLRVVVHRPQPLGRRRADGELHAGTGLVVEASGDRDEVAVRRRDAALREHLVDASTRRDRCDAAAQSGQLIEFGLDRRPDVHPHVIHVEGRGARGVQCPCSPDPLHAVGDGPLDLWQRHDPVVVVAHDGEFAYLCQCDEPLVGLVVLRDAVIQQDVLGAFQPRDVEVAQPPQVQAAADHRVQAAHQIVLDQPAGARTEGEVGDRTPGAAHADSDAPRVRHERQRGAPVQQRRARLVRIRRRLGPVEVEVDDALLTCGAGGDLLADRGGQRAVRREFGESADRRHQPGGPLVQHVVGDRDRTALDLQRAQIVQGVFAVVPTDQHFEQRLLPQDTLLQALAQEADDALGNGGERVHPLGTVRSVRVRREVLDLGRHACEHGSALALDHRLVEPAEPHASGKIADGGEAQLRREHQPVEQLADVHRTVVVRGRLDVPALQDRGDDREVRRRPLLREEDPEHGALELRRAFEVGDAVVREDAAQLDAEQLGQAAAVDVEALQVAVEVLARRVHAQFGARLLVGRPVAAQFGEVGEHAQQFDLAGNDIRTLLGGGITLDEVAVERGAVVGGIDVEAEQHGLQVRERVDSVVCRAGQVEFDGAAGRGHGRLADRLETQQRGAGLDLAAGRDVQFAHRGRERSIDAGLHLHRLEHEDGGARSDLGTDCDRRRDDERRRG